jgi:hypothetical protein
MDHELAALARDEDNDLQEIGCAIWTNEQPAIWIFASVLDSKRILDGMKDVLVGDAVPACREVDFH